LKENKLKESGTAKTQKFTQVGVQVSPAPLKALIITIPIP
jgi:hypothetical protein